MKHAAGDVVLNDHIIPWLTTDSTDIVRHEDGRLKSTDGKYYSPPFSRPQPEWEFAVTVLNVVEILDDYIGEFWDRFMAKPLEWRETHKDNRDFRVPVTSRDPRGLRIPELMALKGVGRERG